MTQASARTQDRMETKAAAHTTQNLDLRAFLEE
jgi:hypothetical protein